MVEDGRKVTGSIGFGNILVVVVFVCVVIVISCTRYELSGRQSTTEFCCTTWCNILFGICARIGRDHTGRWSTRESFFYFSILLLRWLPGLNSCRGKGGHPFFPCLSTFESNFVFLTKQSRSLPRYVVRLKIPGSHW